MADRKMRVLIVDDANLVRLYYRQILEEAGFEVEEALNGLEALEKTARQAGRRVDRRHQYAADGRRHLPQRAEAASLAAVLNSGPRHQHRVRAPPTSQAARAAGANFYRAKPIGREDLARIMAMFCGAPQ